MGSQNDEKSDEKSVQKVSKKVSKKCRKKCPKNDPKSVEKVDALKSLVAKTPIHRGIRVASTAFNVPKKSRRVSPTQTRTFPIP